MSDVQDSTLRGAQAKIKGLLGGGGVDHEAHKKDENVAAEAIKARRVQQEPEQNLVVDDVEGDVEDDGIGETQDDDIRASSAEHEDAHDENDTDESQDSHVQTLVELAESLDVDLDTLYGLKIAATNPRGERTEVSLGEMKDNLQNYLKLSEEQTRFEQERQAFETQRQQVEQVVVQRLTEADQFLSAFEAQLQAEESAINWQHLRETNPSEYSALKADFADRKEKLVGQRLQIQQKAQEQQTEMLQSTYQQMLAKREQEQKALLNAIPDWKDEKKAGAEKENLKKYLLSTGFGEQDIASAMDHRLIVMARKAMMFDQGAKKTEVAKKKVKTLPRRVKPGNTKTANTKTAKQDEMRGRLRKTGRVQDAAALIKSRNLS